MSRLRFALLAFAMCSLVWGQANTASIRGTITDPSAAVIPGAQVTLTNTGTGFQTANKANPAGEYLFEFLPPGTYKVRLEKNGVQQSKSIEIRNGETTYQKIPLQ